MKQAKKLWIIILIFLIVSSAQAREIKPFLDLSGKGGFFKIPFPNDIRRNPDGTINLDDFPPTLLFWLVGSYPALAEKNGFSTSPTIYFRFSGPISTNAFPKSASDSLRRDSTLWLINIDQNSPERGKRIPLIWKFYPERQSWLSGGANLLAMMPLPGFVLRENTTYSAIILKSIAGSNPEIKVPREMEELLNGKEPKARLGKKARAVYAPLNQWLSQPDCPIKKEEILIATVFTTGNPSIEMLKLWNAVQEMPTVKLAEPLRLEREYSEFYVLRTRWFAPQFQRGLPPYSFTGGEIEYDVSGKPRIQRYQKVPLVITVPKSPMSEKGFPLLHFIHGTEGLSSQVVDRGKTFEPDGKPEPGKGPAYVVAKRGIASFGSALPQNAERGGDKMMLLYYAFFNSVGIKNNLLQSAVEQMMLIKLFKELKIPAQLCPETKLPAGVNEIYFDPENFFAMGQSLGSLVLGLYAGVEPSLKAIIPSGEGGHWGLFASRGNFINVQSLNQTGKGMFEAIKVDMFHPLMSLFQTALAPADPLSFTPYIIEKPLNGEPKNVWMAIGLYDHFFRPESQNAIFAGLGLDLAGEIYDPCILEYINLRNRQHLSYPVANNLSSQGKKITGVAVQYLEDGILDGHHINFQLEETKYQYGCFLQSYVRTKTAQVYAPRALEEECH